MQRSNDISQKWILQYFTNTYVNRFQSIHDIKSLSNFLLYIFAKKQQPGKSIPTAVLGGKKRLNEITN